MKQFGWIIMLLTISILQLGAANKKQSASAEMFPAAVAGQKKVVIQLPAQKNEVDFKVEIFVGKSHMLDCNSYFLQGNFKEQVLQGWGYNYYEAQSNGIIGGTKRMCPDRTRKLKFVSLPSYSTNYNSKIPLVIYIPDGMEVKYRIWNAGKLQEIK